MKASEQQLKWYAARAIRERPYVLRYLENEKVTISYLADLPTMLFIRCTQTDIERLRSALYDRVLFYLDPERKSVQAIPDRVMKTFLLLAPYHEKPIIYLAVDDPTFFEGKRKRVIKGIFAGCEGVIRRVRGERRLIVRLSDHSAIATTYIPQEYLEDVE